MGGESAGIAAPPVAQDLPQPGPLRFLLVEDNLVDVELVERVLRRALLEKGLREQRQLAEKKLAEKVEELARSNHDLEQFAYVASHDLQEPLRMVAAYTQLLAERYRGKLDENADKYIGYAVEGALRMQALVHDLLMFSRVGRNGIVRKNLDSNQTVREALQNLEVSLQEAGGVAKQETLPVLHSDST